MKNTQIISLIFLMISAIYACSGTSKNVANGSENKDEPAKIDTSFLGCEICVLEREFKKVENGKNMYERITGELDSCDLIIKQNWISRYDSLNKALETKTKMFGKSFYAAEAACSKRYPIHYVKAETERDSLLMLLDVWYNRIHPTLSDTTCQIPQMENDSYIVKVKGKKHLLTEEQYRRSTRIMRDKYNRLEAYENSMRMDLVKKLSGLDTPDIYCMEIFRRYAEHISFNHKFDPQNDAPEELMVEYDALVKDCDKFEY